MPLPLPLSFSDGLRSFISSSLTIYAPRTFILTVPGFSRVSRTRPPKSEAECRWLEFRPREVIAVAGAGKGALGLEGGMNSSASPIGDIARDMIVDEQMEV